MIRYGVGMGYTLYDDDAYSVTPITEIVGWQVLDGLKSDPQAKRISADGDSIVNLKLGVRFGANNSRLSLGANNSLFIGYGTVLTDQNWYDDIVRLELRWSR